MNIIQYDLIFVNDTVCTVNCILCNGMSKCCLDMNDGTSAILNILYLTEIKVNLRKKIILKHLKNV